MITPVTCRGCNTEYLGYEGHFHKTSYNKNGYHYRCRDCVNSQARKNKAERDSMRRSAYDLEFNKGKNIQKATADRILVGISNLRKKYTWSESGFGWMKSKERDSIIQFKLIIGSCKKPYTRFGDKPPKTV